ncbi:hypothetical protein [Chryseobacterium sp. c4a]|uniref:hypothetical protein n=1 Tax=Chryseobacterium sp. c4a TaxID=1573582 RepID=UPI001358FF50|nr:hypothetical protein [Chryseobacterium sp. c4a]
MKTIIYLLILSLLASCNMQHRAIVKELKTSNSNYQMSYDAMRRGAVLNIDEKGKINKILSEVQPDAAIATTTDLTNKLAAQMPSGQSVSLEQITKITETLSKLGERTASVNMLRDALYRMEEHCINFESQCKGELYWQSFQIVVEAITDLQKEAAKTAESEAKEEMAKTLRVLTPEERAKYNINK